MRRQMPTAERTMTPGANDQDQQRRLDRGDAIKERLQVGKENLEVPRLSRQRRIGQLAHRTQRMIRLSTGI